MKNGKYTGDELSVQDVAKSLLVAGVRVDIAIARAQDIVLERLEYNQKVDEKKKKK